jgi:hypothetical protein
MKLKLMLLMALVMLSGCATPGLRGRTGDIVAANEARQLALACLAWAQEHQDVLPASLEAIKGRAAMTSVSAYELCTTGKLADIKDSAKTILIREKPAGPGARRAVAYADGHADLISTPQP